ncbi:MAG TPA: MerR family transcriptional regulator [Candidatus Babeliales bacterium]|nr:MerR family transcriptional regulator [Candidatus Babeliales bacterium]
MKMQKRQFRIGELAKKLEVEKFVIRFWEKEFNLAPSRSIGGQRFYSEDDFTTFSKIKSLLYSQKFTISGAKKQLAIPAATVMTPRTTMPQKPTQTEQQLLEQLAYLKKQLDTLKNLL